MTTILALAQNVAKDLGYQAPTTLFAAYDEGDTTDYKLVRALHRVSEYISKYWDWPELIAEHTFTSGANGAQTGAIPSDFRRVVKGTVFDRTNHCRIMGPLTPEAWAKREAAVVQVGRPSFRIRGASFLYNSSFSTGATIAYEYVTTKIGATSGGSAVATFTANTDVSVWPDELMHLGMCWAIQTRDLVESGPDFEAFKGRLHEEMTARSNGDPLDMGGDDDVIMDNTGGVIIPADYIDGGAP